jgi:hypothetical protein
MQLRLALALCISFTLSACGLTVPAIHVDDSVDTNILFINEVTRHVHCELRRAVFFTYDNTENIEWLRDWAAKITLTVNVDEKTALSPGLTLTRFFPSFQKTLSTGEVITGQRSFDLGLGASLSSNAVRDQEITWFITFKDLFQERAFATADCGETSRPFLIEGDLKIKESLASGVFPASLSRNVSSPFEKGGPLQVIQHTVSFLIESTGNVTPTWKFVDISANTGGPLFGITRNRKDTLLITMGPTQLSESNRTLRKVVQVVPSRAVEDAHLAKQIGNAVGSNLLNFR